MERSEPSVQHSDKETAILLFFLLPPLGVATTIILNILLLLRVICVFPSPRPLSFLLWKGGHRIFNVRTDISACCADESETVSPQVLTRSAWRTQKRVFTGFHHVASRIRTLATGLAFQCAGHAARHQFSLVTMPAKVDLASYLTLSAHSTVSALQG